MAYRDSTTAAGSSATPSVAVPTGVQADDIVILSCTIDASAARFTGKFPTGFTILEEVGTGPDGGRNAIGWKRLTGADTGSYTFASLGASDTWIAQAFAFSGRDTGNPPTLASTNNSTSHASPVTATVPTITALSGDDLLTINMPDVSASGVFNAYTARPSGYTIAETQESGFVNAAGDYKENVAAGATGTSTYVFTLTSGSSGWYVARVRIPSGSTPATPNSGFFQLM